MRVGQSNFITWGTTLSCQDPQHVGWDVASLIAISYGAFSAVVVVDRQALTVAC